MMKFVAILAIVAFAAAVPEFDEETAPEMELVSVEPTTMFLEAKATVSAMQKKGATEADCKDLATTSCKEVESEVNTDQKSLDKLQSGAQCDNLGQAQVRKATTEHTRTVTEHNKAKVNVKTSYNARVNFGSHRFSSLKVGECGVFFGSRSYLTAKATYERHVRIEVSWRGRVKESLKTKTNAIEAAKRQVYHCRCSTKHTRDTLWKTVSTASRRNRQVKAHAKCKMMSCVLNGTNLSSSKCKSNLVKLRNKKLTSATERVNCAAHHAKIARDKKEKSDKEKSTKLEKSKKHELKTKESAAKSKERKDKAAKRERKAKADERTSKEKSSKLERSNKTRERASKKPTLSCRTDTKASNNAGVIKTNTPGGYTMVGGGMVNHYRSWNAKAAFEEMMPEGNQFRCDTGFGPGRLTCYGRSCKLSKGQSLSCVTRSGRFTGSGAKQVNLPAGYTMTGGGVYNHYRSFNKKAGFEESRPNGNGWYGDMGFGWGDYTVYARGCKASRGTLQCHTAVSGRGNSKVVNCASGYTLTGCGINQHKRTFNSLSGFEDTKPHGNGCHCDSGFGSGDNTCYARCCRIV